MEDRGPSAYIAEFIGTFFLVLFIGIVLAVFQNPPPAVPGAAPGSVPEVLGIGYQDMVPIALTHFFILSMLIATLGGASGAHFNPAVTTTLLALRKIKPPDAMIYILLQLSGAVAAALVVKLVLSDEGDAVNFGATAPNEGALGTKALAPFTLEVIGTFALMWAIMGAAVNPRAEKSLAPIIIAGTLALIVFTIGPLTGAGFNPARSFGPELLAGELGSDFGTWALAYVIGPLVGAFLAGIAYTAVVLKPQEERFGGRLVDTDVPAGQVRGELDALETPGERPIDKLS